MINPFFGAVKYEVDKATAYFRVDRPLLTSSMTPTLYGFIPRTYCLDRIQALSRSSKKGDGDPLDICVITERSISQGEVIHILKQKCLPGAGEVTNFPRFRRVLRLWRNG